jgi:peptidoglycan/LPS O-acetylase OafA/YrhL
VLLAFVASAPSLRVFFWMTSKDAATINYNLTPCRWDALFIGVLGAWLIRQLRYALIIKKRLSVLWALMGLISLSFYPMLRGKYGSISERMLVLWFSVIALLYLSLIFQARYGRIRTLLSYRAPVFIGNISHGL